MIPKQPTTPTSALPSRTERPFKYASPVSAPDGSVGYNRPLENYFDASMAHRLLPVLPPSRLYDTVARAHDHRYQVSPDMVDPSWSTPRPLSLSERPRSLAKLSGDSPEYMGISPDVPGWHPRKSSFEDRRGVVAVTPKEINTLVPYIPPIDASLPPPSREWLDEMAKRFLADAHADFDNSRRTPTDDVTSSSPSPDSDGSSTFFDYDTDSTLDGAATPPLTSLAQSFRQAPQPESESNLDFNSITDADTDSDTNTDLDSDDGYNWSATPITHSGPGSRWLIPRKRPSVVIVNSMYTTLFSSDDEHRSKRRRGVKTGFPNRLSKTHKRHANDAPARQHRKTITTPPKSAHERYTCTERPSFLAPACTSPPGRDATTSSCPSVSSITATVLQMKQVRIASPAIASPLLVFQPNTASFVHPRSPKVFPCGLDGCTQVCASAGDLQRHQQSLRHRAPSHCCLACSKSYTRSDALKRHLNSKASCKREHAVKLANNTQVEEEGAEANDGAVQVVAASSG